MDVPATHNAPPQSTSRAAFPELLGSKLSFQIGHYHSSCPSTEFEAPKQPRTDQKVGERDEDADIVTFRETWGLHLSDVPQCWPEEARGSNDRHPWEQFDSNVIVRFGEGTLNRGYSKGGMRNDVIIPGLSINVDTWPWEFSFDWKVLFTRLFTEEMVMRTFRDKLLEVFVPTLKEEGMSPELKKSAIHYHLRNHSYLQRRAVLAAHRRYKYPLKYDEHHCSRYPCDHEEGRCYKVHTPKRPFGFTPYVYSGGKTLGLDGGGGNFDFLDDEESMVFQVPGWESLNVRDIAQLRVGEEIAEGRYDRADLYGWPDQGHGFLCEGFYEDYFEEMKERRGASDEVIEKRLRAEELDLETFWL